VALGASTSYTPLGVTFDVIVIMIGIAITSDLVHIPSRTHAIVRLAWVRMGEQGGFTGLARVYLFPGAVSFLVFRVFVFVALVGGGIVALITGPH
jgi:hypothetical protein